MEPWALKEDELLYKNYKNVLMGISLLHQGNARRSRKWKNINYQDSFFRAFVRKKTKKAEELLKVVEKETRSYKWLNKAIVTARRNSCNWALYWSICIRSFYSRMDVWKNISGHNLSNRHIPSINTDDMMDVLILFEEAGSSFL